MLLQERDYANEAVPATQRAHWSHALADWMGFVVVVGIMAVGGGMAAQMSARDFWIAIVVGNAILMAFSGVFGWLGARRGESFSLLLERSFPRGTWRLASFYVPIVLIGWYGVEASIFGEFLGAQLGASVGATRALIAVSAVLFSITAFIGFRALSIISFVLVPTIVLIGVFALNRASASGGLSFGFANEQITLTAGIALVAGTWIMGSVTCIPDLTRFCRTPLAGAIVGAGGMGVANTACLLLGGLGAAIAKESDPAKILLGLGYAPLAIGFSLANIWTTNDNNMYSAALNLARALRLSRRTAVLVCVCAGALFAMSGPGKLSFLFPFLLFLGGTAPALGGVVLAANVLDARVRDYRAGVFDGWTAWLAGASAGFFTGGVWSIFIGFCVALIVMVVFAAWRRRRPRLGLAEASSTSSRAHARKS